MCCICGGGTKYDAVFRKVYAKELKLMKPICIYCGKVLSNGSRVDSYWPYYSDNSWHLSCRRKAETVGK